MGNVANLLSNSSRNFLGQDVLILEASSDTDGIWFVVFQVRCSWRVFLTQWTTGSTFRTIQGHMTEQDGGELGLGLSCELFFGRLATEIIRMRDLVGISWVGQKALLPFKLCADSLVFQVLGVVEKVHGRVPELLRTVWLAHCAQTHSVDADKGVVSHDVYPIALAKVGLVSVPDGHLDAITETQVVIAWQTGDEFLDVVCRAASSDLVLGEEYLAKAVVLFQPVSIAVLFPLLLRGLEAFKVGGPFSASVKEVAEEEDGVRINKALQ